MSIDLYILPTSPEYFYWGKLKKKFFELLVPENYHMMKDVSLCKLSNDKAVAENEKLGIPNGKDYQSYYLTQCVENTLGINIAENEPNYLDEVDFIEDFGRNLDKETIQVLIQKWKSVGFHYSVSSNIGRSKFESPLFIVLAAAIAHLCKGYVIVMSDSFTIDIGIYTPAEFQQAKMKSSM